MYAASLSQPSPMKLQSPEVPATRAEEEPTSEGRVDPRKGGVVLIIDDNPTVRRQIRQTLQSTQEFERFLEADNGLVGFKMLVEHRPDVVLCDLIMPVADGMKFL